MKDNEAIKGIAATMIHEQSITICEGAYERPNSLYPGVMKPEVEPCLSCTHRRPTDACVWVCVRVIEKGG